MYCRDYEGKQLNFEASGGLWHASLVMQDKETDTFWSLMTGEGLSGELKGQRLQELPVWRKVQWKDWVADHPETLVLTVPVQHIERNPYEKYFSSDRGFRGAEASDNRLPTKEPIFAFELDGRPYAVPFGGFQGNGATFRAGNRAVFFHRPTDVEVFHSSSAFTVTSGSFVLRDGVWVHDESGATFDPASGGFAGDGAETVAPLSGFDTFWFNWSMVHEDSEILKP